MVSALIVQLGCWTQQTKTTPFLPQSSLSFVRSSFLWRKEKKSRPAACLLFYSLRLLCWDQFLSHLSPPPPLSFCQIPHLAEGVRIHGEKVTEALRPFHERLEACFKQLREKVEKQYGVKTLVRSFCRRRLWFWPLTPLVLDKLICDLLTSEQLEGLSGARWSKRLHPLQNVVQLCVAAQPCISFQLCSRIRICFSSNILYFKVKNKEALLSSILLADIGIHLSWWVSCYLHEAPPPAEVSWCAGSCYQALPASRSNCCFKGFFLPLLSFCPAQGDPFRIGGQWPFQWDNRWTALIFAK